MLPLKPELFPDFRTIPLFADLDSDNLGRLTASSFVQQFPAEVLLQQQGTMPDFLYALISGAVEVTAYHQNATDTVEVMKPGSVFTLAAVAGNEPALSNSRTVCRSRIIMIPASLVRDLIENDCRFAAAVVKQLAAKTRHLVRQLHNQKMRTSTERLANWVIAHSGGAEPSRFEIPYQKRVLASLLGMTPENLSRTFLGLEPFGVRMSGRNIEVFDPQALLDYALPTPLIDGRG
jgi:CRP/FNR family transcriptional activator FtrB